MHRYTNIPLLLSLCLIIFLTLSRNQHPFKQVLCYQDVNNDAQPSQSTIFNVSSNNESQNDIQKEKKKIYAEFRSNYALGLIQNWAERFGRDIHYGSQEATCLRSIHDQYDPIKTGGNSIKLGPNSRPSIKSIDWTQTHAEIVKTISVTMGWHKDAVEAIARESEYLAGNHTYDKNLTSFPYVDVHRLKDIQEKLTEFDGENVEEGSELMLSPASDMDTSDPTEQMPPIEPLPEPSTLIASSGDQPSAEELAELSSYRRLKLIKHKNFDNVLINTEESAIHVPVHIYAGDPQVMNGIAWSDGLTKVFKNNLVVNPKLTNQYFASSSGWMRLFPAQKWQIERTDPDLYDGRMRPWYVAGASSRKDVVILVDSSGSMTGSRRDIAKGVVFEILDTLTDNDHFMVLKFSDTIQQVGVPACESMRVELNGPGIAAKNTMYAGVDSHGQLLSSDISEQGGFGTTKSGNETDIGAFFMLPANGRNVRHLKTNFTIPTSGIANFSQALVTALQVLNNYEKSDRLGSQCNKAIMLITDGSPSDFEDIFNKYNIPNAPIRVFTYLIGREANDLSHTKMMACHNRGYYTHVINLAEVRETVQQYIPVMARPLVLNGTHPVTWTPAYGELTYQILTDWIWESRRRDKARSILAANNRGSTASSSTTNTHVRVTTSGGGVGSLVDYPSGASLDSSSENLDLADGFSYEESMALDSVDLFGYQTNADCFWQTKRNDLLTTVVQPVYDRRNEAVVTEKFLVKSIWTVKETVMRTAQILGVAAADMKINDIVSLAPSHKLGANAYAIMLTNNGFAMYHPEMRSILEPFNNDDPSERNMRILKPFFSSLDFTQVEHILNQSATADAEFLSFRKELVSGLTGWHELETKRSLDCQKRVQTRNQKFYYKSLQHFPFSFLVAIPQPYGSHRIEAQVEIKSSTLPEKLTTYFTTSDFDLWTVHPDYQYCDGPANNTVATLLDMFQRVEMGKFDDIQWRPAESIKPPVFLPNKIVCDKDLVQSLVYDAVATFGFPEACGPPSPSAESSLLGMFGVRFSFVSTRSGLTRVRHYDADNEQIKREALAFAKKHSRAIDETFYSRTVDYNMLVNENASLIQVPFNNYEKIRASLLNIVSSLAAEMTSSSSSSSSIDLDDKQPFVDGMSDPMIDGAGIGTKSGQPTLKSLKDMNLLEKLELLTNASIHVISTQSIVVNEGEQRAVAGVTGVFYNYASFVLRFFNSTNSRFEDGDGFMRGNTKRPAECFVMGDTSQDPTGACDDPAKSIKCGFSNDTIDCLLVDNNGYIVVSEDLDYIGANLKAYDPAIMDKLVRARVFQEINITDYQSVCMRHEEKQSSSSSGLSSSSATGATFLFRQGRNHPSNIIKESAFNLLSSITSNFVSTILYSWTIFTTLTAIFVEQTLAQPSGNNPTTSGYNSFNPKPILLNQQQQQQQTLQPMLSLLPNKTYLRPCEKILTLYESRLGRTGGVGQEMYTTRCQCNSWFVYKQVPKTNLILLIVDSSRACRLGCKDELVNDDTRQKAIDPTDPWEAKYLNTDDQVCSMLERESKLYRKKLDSCFEHHPDEEHIKLCGGATNIAPASMFMILIFALTTTSFALSHFQHSYRTKRVIDYNY